MASIALRPYQNKCLDGIRVLWRERLETGDPVRRVLLTAPTGSGKTVMFSSMAQILLSNPANIQKKVLILTNRQELLNQSGGTLTNFGIRYETIEPKKKKINTRARCFVAMIETYFNRAKKCQWLLDIDLVIIDEAHYGNFKKLFAVFKPGTFIIGVTATPLASDKKDPLSNYYQALCNGPQIPELVAGGFLSPCVTFSPKIDRLGLKLNGGEYSEQSQLNTFAKRQVYDGLLQGYRRICDKYNGGEPMRTVCFNVNVAHSLAVTAMFNEAGITAKHVDGNTPATQRSAIIEAYKNGEFYILNNVGILNAGFDAPATRAIIFNRATNSVSLWLQSCGRGSRLYPGKENFFVLDMGNNWTELGLWDSVRDWDYLWKRTYLKSNPLNVAPAKECKNPECGALVALSAKRCPECGFEFPVKPKDAPTADEFIQVNASMLPPELSAEDRKMKALHYSKAKELLPQMTVAELIHFQELKEYKLGWLLRIVHERAKNEYEFRDMIEEVAALKNYKRGWVNRQCEAEFKNLLV